MDKKLLRLGEVTEATGISRSELYRAMGRGELRVTRIGRAVRVAATDLDAFVDRKREESRIPA